MANQSLVVETTTHGRVLVDDASGVPAGLLVVCHGYAQRAEDALEPARRIPGIGRWRVAAVQALHRFYTRNDERIVASWMTREDRELAIADNVAYIDRAIDAAWPAPGGPARLVLLGFSQGAAMAYRAALLGRHRASGIIALGGDVPPELKAPDARHDWPPVLVGAGRTDRWYTAAKLENDEAHLRTRGVAHDVVRFDGGHEWADGFLTACGDWLAKRST
jgi:predicted esterase